jgi:putative ABC transport system ATP-binding protein
MSERAPVVELRGVAKVYGGPEPLLLRHLRVDRLDRVALFGLEPQAAEMLTHLICGAVLPDEGDVLIDGVATRAMTTDTEWLGSLDRFGLVSHRAVLVDGMSILANLALPLTLSIDPVAPGVRATVESVAADVGLSLARLDAPASTLSPAERLRVHLARALMQEPALILLEHPTSPLPDADARAAFGRSLRSAAEARRAGWMAITEDEVFVKAAEGVRLRVRRQTGEVRAERTWRFWK